MWYPNGECAPYLDTVVVQVNPGLLCLLLLEELIRLDPPLPGLLRLGTSKPHLERNRHIER